MRQKTESTKWELAPYFPENTRFSEPIGAHLTVVSRNENQSINDFHENLVEAYKKTPIDHREIKCVAFDKVVPPNWKAVKEIYLITLNWLALSEARMSSNLPEKIEGKFDFHLTFAVKFLNGNSTPSHENENLESIQCAFQGHLRQIIKEAKSDQEILEEELSEDSSSDNEVPDNEVPVNEVSDNEVSEEEIFEDEIFEDEIFEEEIFEEFEFLKTRNLKKKYLRR